MKKFIYFVMMFVFAAGMTSCIDEVDKGPIGNDEIYTDQNSLEILVGQTVQINASLESAQFVWSSEHPSIATVSAEGVVEGVSPGETRVTVTANGLKHTVNVVVGSRKPSSATRYGNGLLLIWKSASSEMFVGTELYYLDNDSTALTRLVPPTDSITLVEDYAAGLKISSVYCRPGSTDTMRVAPKTIVVKDVAATVSGTKTALIDARNFDYGLDVGWHDEDAQNTMGEDYRSTIGEADCGVDIGIEGNVGNVKQNEWLQYSLDVKDQGLYLFDINMANRDSTSLELYVDEELIATLSFEGTGNITYRWYYPTHPNQQTALLLSPGRHKLKLLFVGEKTLEFKQLRILPKAAFGGEVPVLQYTFDFPSDYRRPTIGDLPLSFERSGSVVDDISSIVRPSTFSPDGEHAIQMVGDGNIKIRVPVPYDEGDDLLKYTVMVDIYTPGPGIDLTYIDSPPWGQNLYSNCVAGDPYKPPGKWLRMVFTFDGTDHTEIKRKWYFDGKLYEGETDRLNSLKALRGGGFFYVQSSFHVASIAFWVNTALDQGQVVALGKVKQTSLGMGVYKATQFGNGLLATFIDLNNLGYKLDYIDSRGQNKTSYHYPHQTRNWVLLSDFGRNLRATSMSQMSPGYYSVADTSLAFPDADIRDLRYTIRPTGETVIDAAHFDAGGEGVAYHQTEEQVHNVADRFRFYHLNEGDCYVPVDYVNGAGTSIKHLTNGEWLAYTVFVNEEGDYYYDINIGETGGTARYSLSVNGVEGETYTYRNGSSYYWHYNTFPETTIATGWPKVHLKAGNNTIRYNVKSTTAVPTAFKFMRKLAPAKGVAKASMFGNGLYIALPDNLIYQYKLKYTNLSDQEVEISVSPLRMDTVIADFKSGLVATTEVDNDNGKVLPYTDSDIVDRVAATTISAGMGRLILPIVDFDGGGEGVGYHDSDDRRDGGVNYRYDTYGEANCAVDIANYPPSIGWTNAGEWWKYTINVEGGGDFYFDMHVAINENMKYKLELNGVDQGEFEIKKWQGGTSNFKWYCDTDIDPYTPNLSVHPVLHMLPGKNTLKVEILSGGIDLSYLRFIRKTPYPYAVTAGTTDSRVTAMSPDLYYAFTGTTKESLKQPNIGSVVLEVEQQSNNSLNPEPKEPIKFGHRPEWNPAPGRNAVIVGRNDQIKVLSPSGSTTANPMKVYTMMWDILRPGTSWFGLLNAGNIDRTTDATLFIRRDGGIGRSSYSNDGNQSGFALPPNQWLRAVMVVDITNSNDMILKVYIDGRHVLTSTSNSGRSEASIKEWFWIFIDSVSNSTGEENDIYTAGFALWENRFLTESEITALGTVVP